MKEKLPKGWVETDLGSITTKPQYGWTSKAGVSGTIKYLRTTDLSKGKINWDNVPFCIKEPEAIEKYQLDKDDIVISRAGSVGLSYRLEEPPQNAVFASYLIRFKPLQVEVKLVEYFLKSPNYWNSISQVSAGIAVQNVNATKLSELPFPLAPLPEQKRIVAKLDQLFGHLEVLKKRLDRIPQLLSDFRQSVLTQAVTGKLTEENEFQTWRELKIENLVKSIKTDIRTGPFGSTLKKSEHQNSGVPVWGIESIGKGGKFTGLNKIFVTEEKAKELKSFEVKGGDLIISRSGTVGEICILPSNIERGIISTNLMKIVLNKDVIDSEYFCWLFIGSSKIKNKMVELCKGSTRLFITQSILKKLEFLVPPLQEQKQIVQRVESLFAKADLIESRYQVLKTKSEELPQAILAKAFRGELVEQLETDGDARELLEEIQQMRAEMVVKKKKRTKKK